MCFCGLHRARVTQIHERHARHFTGIFSRRTVSLHSVPHCIDWVTRFAAAKRRLLAEIDSPELNQELAKSRADLALSEAALTLAKSTAARWQELLKTASVSDQDAAEKQADLATKTAAVESARAGVRRLEELQSFERVTAPFDGTITARNLDVGQLIVVGAGRELFHVAQTQTLLPGLRKELEAVVQQAVRLAMEDESRRPTPDRP